MTVRILHTRSEISCWGACLSGGMHGRTFDRARLSRSAADREPLLTSTYIARVCVDGRNKKKIEKKLKKKKIGPSASIR